MDFLLDGVVYNQIINNHTNTDEWPFDQKFHLILNVAVGGMWGGKKGIDDDSIQDYLGYRNLKSILRYNSYVEE